MITNPFPQSLQQQIDQLKNSPIYGGQPFVAAVDLGLRSLVRFDLTGKLIPATDASADGGAIGMIDAPVTAGTAVIVMGAGALFSEIGVSGATNGSRIFLGADGAMSLSGTGAPRLIQQVGMFIGGQYRFDFRQAGIWVAS